MSSLVWENALRGHLGAEGIPVPPETPLTSFRVLLKGRKPDGTAWSANVTGKDAKVAFDAAETAGVKLYLKRAISPTEVLSEWTETSSAGSPEERVYRVPPMTKIPPRPGRKMHEVWVPSFADEITRLQEFLEDSREGRRFVEVVAVMKETAEMGWSTAKEWEDRLNLLLEEQDDE